MIFLGNFSIFKENKIIFNQNKKYLKVINSFKNQVKLNNVLYNKKHYNYYFYNKISKSINRLNTYLEYFSFGKEKEKYLSFEFLSSFFIFRKKKINFNLKNKIYFFKEKKLIQFNYNFFLFKRRINKLIYLKKYKRFFTFLFIDDSFFLNMLNYSSLLNLKKLLVLDFLYFYLFLKNIKLNKKLLNFRIFDKLLILNRLLLRAFHIHKNFKIFSLFDLREKSRVPDNFLLSSSFRANFFKNTNFLDVIKSKKKDYFDSFLNKLNYKTPKRLILSIKQFFKKFVKKQRKYKFFNSFSSNYSSYRAKKIRRYIKIYRRNNRNKRVNEKHFLNSINNINSVLFDKVDKDKKMHKFKIYHELINRELKINNKTIMKKKSLNFYKLISKEFFKVNKLILKNFLLINLKKESIKDIEESKYDKIIQNYLLNYRKFIYKYKKYNRKYFNKLSLNSLKYNKMILNKKNKKTLLNLYFYKNINKKNINKKNINKKNIKKKYILANSMIKKELGSYRFINIIKNKLINRKKYLPKVQTIKQILYRIKRKIYLKKYINKLYKINKIRNKKKKFFFNRFKENNKISLNFLNLNKFYSNSDFENVFNYRLNTFSNLIDSKLGLKIYLNYFPNMYFLVKFTDNFLNNFALENKTNFLNIIDFFLSFFNYDSLFYFKSNNNNNRFPNYYSKNTNLNQINLSFNYIYPKIYEYNYLKINNSFENKKNYYYNFFTKHRNFYDSNFYIDLLFQSKEESLNTYLLEIYNKLLDNSTYYSSLFIEETEINNNISNYIWTSMLYKNFEKKKIVTTDSFFQEDNNNKINSKFRFNDNVLITRDYIKYFFNFIKNNIKKSLLEDLEKTSKDNIEIEVDNITKKKIENFDFLFIKDKFNYEIFEKTELYSFFFDIFLYQYNEKQNLKKLLNIDIFDFNYVLKINNKILSQLYNTINNKKLKKKSKIFFFSFLNEIENSIYDKSNTVNQIIEQLNIKLSNKSFFQKYNNFQDIFYLKLFFPKLLDFFKKRSLKFSKIRKFKTVRFSHNIYSINILNKSVLKKRRLFSQYAIKIPFKFNIYPISIPILKKKKSKFYFFRKRSKLKFGQFYFLDLYDSYFKLKDIQLKKYMIENKLSNLLKIDLYIKNLFFAIDLINIKKKNYISDENNYYYNSSYFSNLIYNKIYVNKLKIFFKDENFHNKIINLDKKIFMEFSLSKLNNHKSLIDFNDSFFFQANLFKFIHKIKKHKFFFNKYLYKTKKRLSINSLNFYYNFKSKNLNKKYYNLIKNEISYKNNNYFLYQYLTKYKQIKKKTVFLKKVAKKFLGRNSKHFFAYRSFLRHLRNIYNSRAKPGKVKDSILKYLRKPNIFKNIYLEIKKKVLKIRYKFIINFVYHFLNKINNKFINKNKLNYFNLIYLNKLEISNINIFNTFLRKINKKNNLKFYDLFFSFNLLKKKINSKLFFDSYKNSYKYFFLNNKSIENLILLNFISNRKSYLLYLSLNNLIEKKDILNKYNYLFNNKKRNKYLKDSIISSVKLFSNKLIEGPRFSLYKSNYINSYFNILLFKNKILNETLININKNIIKLFNNKYNCNINSIRKIFINFLNNSLFKLYNTKLKTLIIYKYKFNKTYIEIIKNKKNRSYLGNYYVYLVQKLNEFFAKLKYISYNLLYKMHEVRNLNIYSPLNISFNIYFFINNYNNSFELRNYFNFKLKGYSKNFKNIGGVLLFKIGL